MACRPMPIDYRRQEQRHNLILEIISQKSKDTERFVVRPERFRHPNVGQPSKPILRSKFILTIRQSNPSLATIEYPGQKENTIWAC